MRAILVAEDDKPIREMLAEMLADREDWAVTAVTDGAALLRVLDSVRPDLILLDVEMPGLDGIETYRLLRQREGLGEVPVLFVTAFPEQVREAGLPGPCGRLPKPFDLDDLLALVERLLGERGQGRCG